MKTYIALFRGINVGGKNLLPMKVLKELLESLDLQQVRTYIQSGNAVFQGEQAADARLAESISAEIKKIHGFEPRVLLLKSEELTGAIQSNPFPDAEPKPQTLHLGFLTAVPEKPDLDALENFRGESERFALKGKVFYLHAPEGIGRSKLAAQAERLLGVAMTVRNWRTVNKLMAMATEDGGG
jgi:uncharacterized protein (DUF1697 family)